MNIELSANEARVIGVLMEKSVTTPEQYPLSLNALTAGCNQKTSRDPVMNLTPGTVQHTVNGLKTRHLVASPRESVGRVEKFQHRLCNTEFGKLRFSPAEYAVVCLLLLRGPQTLGELRSRSGRLHEFRDLSETEAAVDSLIEREDGPFVKQLAREPGRKDVRFAHCFGPLPQAGTRAAVTVSAPRPVPRPGADDERIEELEARVAALEQAVRALQRVE